MERFYGRQHAVELTGDDTEALLRAWHAAATRHDHAGAPVLAAWLDERLRHRAFGCRGFRITPAPEPIASSDTLSCFARIVQAMAAELAAGTREFLHRPIDGPRRRQWLADILDLLGFLNEARGVPFDEGAPNVGATEAFDVTLRRMWSRFSEQSRRENYLFPDDPAYPQPEQLLDYLDRILALAVQDGREPRREWPFPKILWEREILLEKLGRYDELAETMRRSAALEGEAFRRATEEYLGTIPAT